MERKISVGSDGVTWCGPVLVELLVGTHPDIVRAQIEGARMRAGCSRSRRWGPMTSAEVRHAIAMGGGVCGPIVDPYKIEKRRPTLAAWARTVEPGTYVVLVTGHFIMVEVGKNLRWTDNTTKGKWEPWTTARVRKRIRNYFKVSRGRT